MKNIIRWFVLLIHRDMQNFEMDEATNKTVYRQIMKRTKRPAETNDALQKCAGMESAK